MNPAYSIPEDGTFADKRIETNYYLLRILTVQNALHRLSLLRQGKRVGTCQIVGCGSDHAEEGVHIFESSGQCGLGGVIDDADFEAFDCEFGLGGARKDDETEAGGDASKSYGRHPLWRS